MSVAGNEEQPGSLGVGGEKEGCPPAVLPDPAAQDRIRDINHKYRLELINASTLLVLVATAFIGAKAMAIYLDQNKIQVSRALYDYDRNMLAAARQDPQLEAFFVELPEKMEAEARADLRVSLIVKGDYNTRKWTDIPDLACLIYEQDDFHNDTKNQLRQAFGVAEDMVYLLYNAMEARRRGFLDKGDYETWMSYIRDVGDHPLFLAVLHLWRKLGYLDQAAAKEFHARLTRPGSRQRKTLERFYPEMLDSNWPTRVGEEPYHGCPNFAPWGGQRPQTIAPRGPSAQDR